MKTSKISPLKVLVCTYLIHCFISRMYIHVVYNTRKIVFYRGHLLLVHVLPYQSLAIIFMLLLLMSMEMLMKEYTQAIVLMIPWVMVWVDSV